MHSSGSGPAVAPEPAGIIDNPGTPVASGMSTAAGPSALDEDRADVAAVSLVGGQQGSAEAEGSAKEVAGQTATASPAQSLDQAKVPREIRLAFAGAWPWSVNVDRDDLYSQASTVHSVLACLPAEHNGSHTCVGVIMCILTSSCLLMTYLL